MPVHVKWPIRPVVTVTMGFGWSEVHWSDGARSAPFDAGDTIDVDVKLVWEDPYGGAGWFRVWVETLDLATSQWKPDPANHPDEFFVDASHHETGSTTRTYGIPITSRLSVFRIKVATKDRAHATGDGPLASIGWTDEDDPQNFREFHAYVDHIGDFSLDYLPVTLLYSPPGQDMYAAVTQTSEYGTALAFNFSEAVGTRSGDSSTVRGGVKANFGYVGVGAQASDQYTTEESERLEEAMTNKITMTYEWGSTLIADNQRVIGRNHWGALGDIFLLLRNPWFSVCANDQGELEIAGCGRTRTETELVLVPVHRLLRPGDDPVANLIPEETRRRLLELDPFVVNLDRFFPAATADPNTPLTDAVNQYRDPSGGWGLGFLFGGNRAELVARYSISTGIELDLSRAQHIQLQESHTNSSQYIAQVNEVVSGSMDFDVSLFGIGVGVGGDQSSSSGTYTEVSYQSSRELVLGEVKTALCRLVRNQVQADLDDIEVWWDKQFSTFMFRRVVPGATKLTGILFAPLGERLQNIAVILVSEAVFETLRQRYPFLFEDVLGDLGVDPRDPIGDIDAFLDALARRDPHFDRLSERLPAESAYRTMTNGSGAYGIPNVPPGRYVLFAGNQRRRVEIRKPEAGRAAIERLDVHRVKRPLDLRRSALWELREAAGVSRANARKLQAVLRNSRRLDPDLLAKALAAVKVDAKAFAAAAHVRFAEAPPTPRRPVLGGWVLDERGEPAAHAEVLVTPLDRGAEGQDKARPIRAFTDARGKYRIELPRRTGHYRVQCGNRSAPDVEVSEVEFELGTYKQVDLEGVRQRLDLKKVSQWRLKTLLGIELPDARELATKLRKANAAEAREILRGRGEAGESLFERFDIGSE